MRRFILWAGIWGLLFAAGPALAHCITVAGEFKLWNGRPPGLRLHDEENDVWYGVSDEDPVPDKFAERIHGDKPMLGKFCLTKKGYSTTVPYQKAPIIMVLITKFEFKQAVEHKH